MLIQHKGAIVGSANASTFGDINSINDAGNYEFNTICSVSGNEVILKATFLNQYDPSGQVQLVSIPSYGSVVVSGPITANSWDPVAGKGGVVVIEASDTIFLNADINVSGQGFQGGVLVNYPIPPFDCSFAVTVNNYFLSLAGTGDFTGGKKGEGIAAYIVNEECGMGKLANGGGGGNNTNTGGAGGGNYGTGGAGGQRAGESFFKCHGAFPGIGGVSLASFGYSAANNRIFFGGGGGAGQENNGAGLPGGNGGGIIILSAPVIVGGGGRLLASGIVPLNPINTDPTQAEGDGGGGGGAGGTVIINATKVIGPVIAQAMGSNGSNSSNQVNDCTGPGGGGGGGVIWAAGAGFPAGVTATVTGGVNGVVSAGNTLASCKGLPNGATSGTIGTTLAAYTLPQSVSNTCIVLASSVLKYFTGQQVDEGTLLSWALNSPGAAVTINSFTIERSDDQVHFTTLATLPSSTDSVVYRFTDATVLPGTVFYRLRWMDQQGANSYSRIVAITRPMGASIEWVGLQPNPVSDQLSVNFFSNSEGRATLCLFAAQGQRLAAIPLVLHVGITTTILPVKNLPNATYFLVLEATDHRWVRSFIKK